MEYSLISALVAVVVMARRILMRLEKIGQICLPDDQWGSGGVLPGGPANTLDILGATTMISQLTPNMSIPVAGDTIEQEWF